MNVFADRSELNLATHDYVAHPSTNPQHSAAFCLTTELGGGSVPPVVAFLRRGVIPGSAIPAARLPAFRPLSAAPGFHNNYPFFWLTPELYQEAAGWHPRLARRVQATFGWNFEEFDAAMRTAEVLIGWKFPRENLAERAPRLRWIHVTGAGVDHLLPHDWIPPGVVLTNSSGVHRPKAAEYAMMAILMLNNRIPLHVTNQRRSRWERAFNTPVSGKAVAVIGVGNMGGAAAERAKQLGLRVLGVRRSGRPHRYPDMVLSVVKAGQEIGFHNYLHEPPPHAHRGARRGSRPPRMCRYRAVDRISALGLSFADLAIQQQHDSNPRRCGLQVYERLYAFAPAHLQQAQRQAA